MKGNGFTLQDAVTFQYPKRIQSLKGELQLLQKDLERRNQAMEVQPGFAITLQGKVYEKHKEAGEVLRGIIEGVTAFTRHEVGIYKGFRYLSKMICWDRSCSFRERRSIVWS